jgi:hypothetical protein
LSAAEVFERRPAILDIFLDLFERAADVAVGVDVVDQHSPRLANLGGHSTNAHCP